MDFFNGFLSKLAILLVVFCALGMIDARYNPFRALLHSACRHANHLVSEMPSFLR